MGLLESNSDFDHGDTLKNEWDWLRETNPAKKPQFDAVVANPPFSYRWKPRDEASDLHGFHYLKDDGAMAIILPHGVLFRGAAEARIRQKLLEDGHIDTVIGLPANLFYSTGIPVCILVLKKCKRSDDVLFINAEKHFDKGRRQNFLTEDHVKKIVETYQHRREEERYSRCVPMSVIADENDYNLNISRYVSTAEAEEEIDLAATHAELVEIEDKIKDAKERHNGFLAELGLPELP